MQNKFLYLSQDKQAKYLDIDSSGSLLSKVINVGNRITMTDDTGTTQYDYDNLNNLIEKYIS